MDFDQMPHSKTLDFSPYSPWPQVLPPIEWRGVRLCGWDSKLKCVDSSAQSFHDLVFAIYPSLSLSELARLYQLAANQTQIDWAELFKKYELRDSEDLRTTLRFLARLPRTFQDWVHEKDLSVRDLAPMRTVEPSSLFQGAVEKLLSYQPSKVDGVRTLELLAELSLMEKLPSAWTEASFSDFVKSLTALRYPMATEHQAMTDQFWKTFSWPMGVQAQVVRRGDKTGVEVKYFARSKEELISKSKRLAETLEGETHE